MYDWKQIFLQPDLPWDTGPPDLDENTKMIRVPTPFYSMVVCALESNDVMEIDNEVARCELDTHANLPVIGGNAYVLAYTGRTASVSPYSPDYKAK